jgi:hypothetical protein
VPLGPRTITLSGVAHAHLIERLQLDALHLAAVDDHTVAAAQIAQHEMPPLARDLGVHARHGGRFQGEIGALRVTSDDVSLELQQVCGR